MVCLLSTWLFWDSFFSFLRFFFMWTILKSLLNLLQYSFYFIFLFIGHVVCGILAPWPGMEPAPAAWKGKVLTAGLPEKSFILVVMFINSLFLFTNSSILLYGYTKFIYPLMYWWIFRLFPVFGYYKQSCYEHSCISLCVGICFHLSWGDS